MLKTAVLHNFFLWKVWLEFFDEQKVLKQKPFLTDFTVTLDQFKATICNFFYTEYVSLVSRNLHTDWLLVIGYYYNFLNKII